jgi:tRNA A37 threonylcarbamoyladenosine synthetase subunit TsaC/SUA5/YrdC
MQTSRRLGGTNEDFIDLAWTNQNKISARSAFHSAMSAYKYLHRGTNSLSFRLPKNKLILNILKISGPLIAPSVKLGRLRSQRKISQEAKSYFGNKVFYVDRGDLISKPSTLIDLRKKKIKILREGEEIKKIHLLIKKLI